MTSKAANRVLVGMLAGVVLGAALGYYFPDLMLSISVIGKLFVSALQLIVVPLVAAALIAGIAALGDIRKLGRPLITTLLYFAATTAIAVGIGLALAAFLLPGWGVGTIGATLPPNAAALELTGLSEILLAFIPSSLPGAAIEGQYLGIIIFALFFGGVLVTLGRRGKVISDLVDVVREVVLKLVYVILYAAPIGLFSVVGSIVAANSGSLGELAGSLSYYALAVGGGLLIHTALVLPLILKYVGQRSPLSYFSGMAPALSTALATGSSTVAFPIAYTGVVDKNKVDGRAAALAMPLGMTLNLNGTAMHVAIGAVFVAQAYAVDLSALQVVTIAALSILVSFGAAAVPYAGIFLLIFVMRAAGFPPEAYAGIGLIIGVDWLFDRFRAVVNIWGDSVGAAVTAAALQPKAARAHPAGRAGARPAVPVSARTRPRRDDRDRATRTPVGAERGHRQRGQQVRGGARDRVPRERPERKRESRRGDAARTSSAGHRRPTPPGERRPAAPSRETAERKMAHPDALPEFDRTSRETVRSDSQRPSPPTAPESPLPATAAPAGVEQAATSGRPEMEREVSPVTDLTGDSPFPDEVTTHEKKETPVMAEEASEPEYGRRKARRGKVVARDSTAQAPPDKPLTPDTEEEFSLDGISFGRRKRKRTR